MAVRVLVVDDSGFFRRRVTEILNSDRELEVVGSAVDGAEAIKKVQELRPDVVTMDIEMPVMDGITAVRQIMSLRPTPILMFSTLTTAGAQATLDALDAGAVDFLPKRFEDISLNRDEATRILCERVRAIGRHGLRASIPRSAAPASPPARSRPEPTPPITARPAAAPTPAATTPRAGPRIGVYKLVVIGTSTGGPVALQQVLTKLPADFPVPLLLVQHMPASFTPAFAQRLNQQCAITVKEASDGDALAPGTALLAPGGKQMVLEARGATAVVRVVDSEPGQTYKPCVDITFTSVAKIFSGKTLALVLTGMGSDGCEGARVLKAGGSAVWAQDERSCVVYGMPAAVVKAGLADEVLALTDIGSHLAQKV